MPKKTKRTKKATRSTAKAAREPRPCACGCGKQTSGSDFRMGHDQKLRGQIRRGETLRPESKAFLAAHKSDPHYAPAKAAKASKPSKPVKSVTPAVVAVDGESKSLIQ